MDLANGWGRWGGVIDHLAIDVSDIARARAFYAAALAPLGYAVIREEANDAGAPVVMLGVAGEIGFIIAGGAPVGTGTHIAFRADSAEAVDGFHAAALAAGGRDNGAPGLRPRYSGEYYAAFVLDPDGLNVEAVCHLEAVR